MNKSVENIMLKVGDDGPAVEDLQRRLSKIGYLKDSEVDNYYGELTASAVKRFCEDKDLPPTEYVTDHVWAKLIDATFKLGDRNLFLNMPYFHGNDVLELQHALGALGFSVRYYDSIFGPSTERALRRFQINMGLPSDGIVGSQTYAAIKNLAFTWEDKKPVVDNADLGIRVFWRASEVLEKNPICLFGTDDFTRDVAKRISKLARATNPYSKVLDSAVYSVAPSADTLLFQIMLPDSKSVASDGAPRCLYDETENDSYRSDTDDNTPEERSRFVKRLVAAVPAAKKNTPQRLTVQLPGRKWWNAGEDRSAQHFAITILDALCSALEILENNDKLPLDLDVENKSAGEHTVIQEKSNDEAAATENPTTGEYAASQNQPAGEADTTQNFSDQKE